MSENQVARWVGGSPMGVLVRLILVSILVGVILSALGLDPFDIIHSIERQRYYDVLRAESAGIVPLILESLENGMEMVQRFFQELEEARDQKRSA